MLVKALDDKGMQRDFVFFVAFDSKGENLEKTVWWSPDQLKERLLKVYHSRQWSKHARVDCAFLIVQWRGKAEQVEQKSLAGPAESTGHLSNVA